MRITSGGEHHIRSLRSRYRTDHLIFFVQGHVTIRDQNTNLRLLAGCTRGCPRLGMDHRPTAETVSKLDLPCHEYQLLAVAGVCEACNYVHRSVYSVPFAVANGPHSRPILRSRLSMLECWPFATANGTEYAAAQPPATARWY